MRILIFTQKVDFDDPILGFFHRWIEEFAKHFEKVFVVCLQKGKFNLPENVEVYSLGKEDGASRLKYIFRFFNICFFQSLNYDAVFVHMNPVYFLLGGLWWKISGTKTALWYVHRSVDCKLRVAEFFADKIFTVSVGTFKLKSSKVQAFGHGMPLEVFRRPDNYKRKNDKFRIVSVSRISPIKNLDILIESTRLLNTKIPNLEVVIVGAPAVRGDAQYLDSLKKMVKEKHLDGVVKFTGNVSNNDIKNYYWESDIAVNLSPDGGVDKAVLESMASGTLVLASNRSFKEYFGDFQNELLFKERDAEDLAQKIVDISVSQNKEEIRDFLLKQVEKKSSLQSLISKISQEMK